MPERSSQNPWTLFERPKALPIEDDLATKVRHEMIRAGDRRWVEELAVAEELHGRYLANRPHQQAFQRHLDLFKSINDIHVPLQRTQGQRGIAVLNGFQEHLIELLGLEHADKVTWGYVRQMKDQANQATQVGGYDAWCGIKINKLAMAIGAEKLLGEWVNPLSDKLVSAVPNIDLDEVQRFSSQIWSGVVLDRRYGVKTGFYTSPLFLPASKAFFVCEPNLYTGVEERPKLKHSIKPDLVTLVGVGSKPKFGDKIDPTREEFFISKTIADLTTVRVHDVSQMHAVEIDGTIRLNPMSQIPLRRSFEARDAAEIYDLWRLFTFLRIHDLTRRADLVEGMPSIDQLEEDTVTETKKWWGFQKRPIQNVNYRLLVVPRLKLEEPQETKIEGEKRFVDRYHVEWFVRRLPDIQTKTGKAYTASDKAKEYARQHNIILQDGETIVRSHDRGTLNPESNAEKRPRKIKFRGQK